MINLLESMGPGSNSQPLDQQSDLIPIAIWGLTQVHVLHLPIINVFLFARSASINSICSVADQEGVQSNHPPWPPLLNIRNNLVLMRPNYFIFMEYLREMR